MKNRANRYLWGNKVFKRTMTSSGSTVEEPKYEDEVRIPTTRARVNRDIIVRGSDLRVFARE
jgi:hypothetical protein